MASIPLAKLDPNPHRDFTLYPIDETQVQALVDSIMRDPKNPDFWGGVCVRPVHAGNAIRYQIACGHHRIEAAKRTKLKEVECNVNDYDDAAMLDLMVTENATQMGHNAGAFCDSVAAITRELANVMLRTEDWKDVNGTVDIFESKAQFGRAKAALLDGSGLGERIVKARAHDVLSTREVREALATLKATGTISRIVEEVAAAIEAEPEPEPAAPEPVKAAKKKQKKQATQAAKQTKAANPVKVAEGIASVFATPAQLTAFREAMSTEGAQHFFPVNQHKAMAAKLLEEVSAATGKSKENVTTAAVRGWVRDQVAAATGAQRKLDKQEKERYEKEQAKLLLDSYSDNIAGSLRSIISYSAKIAEINKKYPDLTIRGRARIAASLDNAADAIKQLKKLWR